MSTTGATTTVRPRSTEDADASPGDVLSRTFNGLRDELVSTLLYVLGNRDDAQDAAQEAFLKCWRSRASLPDVRDLRACRRRYFAEQPDLLEDEIGDSG